MPSLLRKFKIAVNTYKYKRSLFNRIRSVDELYNGLKQDQEIYLEKERKSDPLNIYYKGRYEALKWMFKDN